MTSLAVSALPLASRLPALRAELARQGLDGFVVPRADCHQGEYVPANAERLAWVSGFTGSAGTAVVLAGAAALFVDGRYTVQAAQEADPAVWTVCHAADAPLEAWIAEALPRGAVLGYDPWLHTLAGVAALAEAVDKAGGILKAVERNPVDAVWTDRPPPPLAPVEPHPLAFSGQEAAAKRAGVADALRRDGLGAAVISAPDALAWLFNLRGGDVPYTPLPLGFALVRDDGSAVLVMESAKLTAAARAALDLDTPGAAVSQVEPEDLGAVLDGLSGLAVRLDRASGAAWIADRLQAAGARVKTGEDPCALPRARKNAVELDGLRAAHRRDGVALVRFFHWLEQALAAGSLSEMQASDRLEAFRAEGEHFRGLSFPTIAGSGPNGAIVHYRVTAESDRVLRPGELFLLDSGGQYRDGTTDVTRTLAVGEPSAEMRRRYTQVLKGHLAVGAAVFPAGTTGSQLDALARLALWADGVDYDHGTGHGVGSYLSVHEGPQRISKIGNAIALDPGMVLSNEPGYYKPGGYGIRIENLIVVADVAEPPPGAERPLRRFEALTLVPYDRRLIEAALLTAQERALVDAYHARVLASLEPLLPLADERAWLRAACAAL